LCTKISLTISYKWKKYSFDFIRKSKQRRIKLIKRFDVIMKRCSKSKNSKYMKISCEKILLFEFCVSQMSWDSAWIFSTCVLSFSERNRLTCEHWCNELIMSRKKSIILTSSYDFISYNAKKKESRCQLEIQNLISCVKSWILMTSLIRNSK
jgi:hypothetical protein